MKKLAIGCLLLILLAVGGVFAFISTLPNDYRVERTTRIEASAETIYPHLANLKEWPNWTVWNTNLDPTATWEYSGSESGVGSVTEWQGAPMGEGGVGNGKMVITETTPSKSVGYDLTFTEDDGTEMPSKGELSLVADGGSTKVTWVMHGTTEGFMGKMTVLAMDTMVGASFDKGLRKLRDLAEAETAPAVTTGD